MEARTKAYIEGMETAMSDFKENGKLFLMVVINNLNQEKFDMDYDKGYYEKAMELLE